MDETKRNKKVLKIIIGIAALVLLIAGAALLYWKFSDKPVKGAKAITIEVVDDTSAKKSYDLQTDAEFLHQAMEETKGLTFSGQESEYGLMIEVVNNVKAVYAEDGAYWSVYVNGEYAMNGIDTQPVKDGETYKIEYTKAE